MMKCGHTNENYYHIRDTRGRDEQGCRACDELAQHLVVVGSRTLTETVTLSNRKNVTGTFLGDGILVTVEDKNAIVTPEKWAELKAWVESLPTKPE